jgi:hypothetical protein
LEPWWGKSWPHMATISSESCIPCREWYHWSY